MLHTSFGLAVVGSQFFYHLRLSDGPSDGSSDGPSDSVLPFFHLAFAQFLPFQCYT